MREKTVDQIDPDPDFVEFKIIERTISCVITVSILLNYHCSIVV